MREEFQAFNFRQSTLDVIEQANTILAEYKRDGLVLTLRQLYYQFVSRNLIANKATEYDRLGDIVSKGRLAGMIDWAMLEDRGRQLEGVTHWENPAEVVDAAARSYKEDLWRTQKYRPEVWIEKDALIGVIERACRELRVDYFACRGYSSQSAQYEAGKRLQAYAVGGQRVVIFHLGDHDPSGIDMTRDNADRLAMFAEGRVDVRRIALNMPQVEQYNPPPNPTKESDGRSGAYIAEFGGECWELDALDPHVIDRLVREHVGGLIDRKKWKAAEDEEKANRQALIATSDRWDEVREFVA